MKHEKWHWMLIMTDVSRLTDKVSTRIVIPSESIALNLRANPIFLTFTAEALALYTELKLIKVYTGLLSSLKIADISCMCAIVVGNAHKAKLLHMYLHLIVYRKSAAQYLSVFLPPNHYPNLSTQWNQHFTTRFNALSITLPQSS